MKFKSSVLLVALLTAGMTHSAFCAKKSDNQKSYDPNNQEQSNNQQSYDPNNQEQKNGRKQSNSLAFEDKKNLAMMRLMAKMIVKEEAINERDKLADALYAAHRANLLRTAQHTAEKFKAEAEVLVNDLVGFLEMLNIARGIIEESFNKSQIVNGYSDEQKKKALLLRLIDLEQEEQERLLRSTIANAEEFTDLLNQLSAVNEVLLANLPKAVKAAIGPHMSARLKSVNESNQS